MGKHEAQLNALRLQDQQVSFKNHMSSREVVYIPEPQKSLNICYGGFEITEAVLGITRTGLGLPKTGLGLTEFGFGIT